MQAIAEEEEGIGGATSEPEAEVPEVPEEEFSESPEEASDEVTKEEASADPEAPPSDAISAQAQAPRAIPSIEGHSRSELLENAREIRAKSTVSFAQENAIRSMYRHVEDAFADAEKKAEKAEDRAGLLSSQAQVLRRQLRTLEDMALLHGIVLSAPPDYDTSDFTASDVDADAYADERETGRQGRGASEAELFTDAEAKAEDPDAEAPEQEADPMVMLSNQIQESSTRGTCMYHLDLPAVGQIELATIGRPKVGACAECWQEYQEAQAAKAPEEGTLFEHGKGNTDLVWKADPTSPTGMRWIPKELASQIDASKVLSAQWAAEHKAKQDAGQVAQDAAGPNETPEGGPAEAKPVEPTNKPGGPAETPSGGPQETGVKPARKRSSSRPMKADPVKAEPAQATPPPVVPAEASSASSAQAIAPEASNVTPIADGAKRRAARGSSKVTQTAI